MTVSRKESEAGILKVILEGDGDFIELNDLQRRDVLIVSDLLKAGYIEGQMFLSGDGRYRITGSGETHLDRVSRELCDEENEASAVFSEKRTNMTDKRRSLKAWVFGSIAAMFTGIWFLFQNTEPTKVCPLLPAEFASWLERCANTPPGVAG